MLRSIEIVIDPDGKAYSIEAHGFAGKGCKAATRPYELVLGAPTEVKQKMEMHAADPAKLKPGVRR